jgi:hypothetical protein
MSYKEIITVYPAKNDKTPENESRGKVQSFNLKTSDGI